MQKKDSKMEMAAEMVRKFPNLGNRTLGRKLRDARPDLYSSIEAARSCVRSAVGQNGARNRSAGQARTDIKRTPGDHRRVTLVELPESHAETWEPLALPEGRYGVLSDVHIPYHDKIALEATVAHLRKRKVDGIVLNGDIGDFYSVSRFIKDPRKRRLFEEVHAQRDFLAWVRDQFPKARIIYKQGNHEERWEHHVWAMNPALFGLDELTFDNLLELHDRGIELTERRQLITAGHLNILHGHELEQGASSPVNPARGAFMRTKECVLIGHRHQTSEHAETTLRRKIISTWSTGCLCGLWPDYAVVNRWNHGFAEVEVGKGKSFEVHNHKIINGTVY